MSQLRFLGSCREIGRSGFLLEAGNEKLLVDYGVKFQDNPVFPPTVATDNLEGVVLTHAHLDHSGGIPKLLSDENLSLFCTPATRDLTMLLVRDMFDISHGRLPYTRRDIARIRGQCQPTTYEETFPLGRTFEVTLFNAGHIPGSAMVSVSNGGKRILFTGDFNALQTQLNPGVRQNLPKHDLVVTESTYANRVNPKREETEEALVQTIVETMERGGCVLIPAFAVGRSQELMCILAKYNIHDKYPVYIDGMARSVNEILIRHPGYILSPKAFEYAVQRTRIINDNRDRAEAVKRGGVIISPAGMLKGGASFAYFKMLYDDDRHTLAIVSFQIPGTPGAELLDKKRITVGNRVLEVSADVRYHHLSSHSDSRGLMDVLTSIPGDPEFYIVHGESDTCDALAEKLEKKGRKAHVPEVGDTVEV